MDKNSKSVTSLFIVLALLALVALAVSVGRQNQTDIKDRLVPGLEDQLNQVNAVRLTGAGDTLIADIRNQEGAWVVANSDGYAADVGKLRTLLLDLAEAEIVETTTALPKNFARIGVDDISSTEAGGIQMELDGTNNPIRLIIGDTSSGNTTFARRADETQSWRVSGSLQPGRSTSDWVNKAVIDIPAVEVLSVTISHADGEVVEIDKSGTGYILADQPADRPLKNAGILNSIAGALANVELEEVRATESLNKASAEQIATIDVQAANGLAVNIEAFQERETVWLTFKPASDTDIITDIAAADSDNPDDDSSAGAAAADLASDLSSRLSGWAYRIPTYKSDWLLKRNQDLLKETAD